MRRWIGAWLMGVALLHTALALVVFQRPLAALVERGLWNAVVGDAQRAVAAWFLLFGVLLWICGQAIWALERSGDGRLPRSLGAAIALLATLGVVLMPMSGFWLAWPPALAILLRRSR